MPAYHARPISLEDIDDYFAHLNPIAHRIACDIRNTKSTYGHLWYTLNSNEQNDIINETLIKPEISLRYFDNFPTPSSSDRSSLSSGKYGDGAKSPSADSMTAVVLSVATTRGEQLQINQTKRISKVKPMPASSTKNYHVYNGRNLRTFALQKVALKIIQDDTLGTYRDEHSLPFSYRTKSQINLQQLNNLDLAANKVEYNFIEDEVYLLGQAKSNQYTAMQNNAEIKKNLSQFKKLRNEMSVNEKKISCTVKDEMPSNAGCYEKFENGHDIKRMPPAKEREKNSYTPELVASKPNKNSNVLKAFIQSPITYKAYRDPYYESEETANLMHNCGGSGFITASSSSATTSDDDDRNADEDDDDEKTLCEEVKLLSNDIGMRGFDFLNNW